MTKNLHLQVLYIIINFVGENENDRVLCKAINITIFSQHGQNIVYHQHTKHVHNIFMKNEWVIHKN